MMQLHINEIAHHVAPGAHALVLLDQAGWHLTGKLSVPANMTLIALPSKAPELNPVENVWQFLRENRLSNRIFNSYEEVVAFSCDAWSRLIDQPWAIMSIGTRNRAHGY